MANYRGYNISCDSSLVSGVEKVFNDAVETIETKAQELKTKIDDLIEYASLDPYVSASVSATASDTAVTELGTVVSESITKLKSIIKSINDYSDGTWADETNKLFLDELINGISPPSQPPSAPPVSKEPTITDEETLPTDPEPPVSQEQENSELDSEIIVSTINPYPDTDSQEYFIPSVQSFSSTALEDTDSQSETIAPENLSGSFSAFDSDSFPSFGNGNFSVPTISTKKASGIKSSSVIGVSGIAIAAAAALSGKLIYGKDKESEDNELGDEEDEIDSIDVQIGKETATENLEEGFVSGLNIVDFKNSILEDEEDV